METNRHTKIKELARQETWRHTAPMLVEALSPLVISPEDREWAGGLTLDESDRLKREFYDRLSEADKAEDGESENVVVIWGGKKSQFLRLRRLVGEVGGPVALAVTGEGVVRTRAEAAAKRLRRLYEHFGTLDVYGLEQEGGVTIFPDANNPGWWELTVVGREWVKALRRLG
ncbi:MAG: hypothetical protein ACO1SV_23605 [Fimbriimonas sp.]